MSEYGGAEQLQSLVCKSLGRAEPPAISTPTECEECREKNALASFRITGRSLCVDCFKLFFQKRAEPARKPAMQRRKIASPLGRIGARPVRNPLTPEKQSQ